MFHLESVKSCRLAASTPDDSLHQTFLGLKVTSNAMFSFPQDLHQFAQQLRVHLVGGAEAETEEQLLAPLCQLVLVGVEKVWRVWWDVDEVLNLGHQAGKLTNLPTVEVFSSVFPPQSQLLINPAASLVESVRPGALGLLVHVLRPGCGLRLGQGGVELHQEELGKGLPGPVYSSVVQNLCLVPCHLGRQKF